VGVTVPVGCVALGAGSSGISTCACVGEKTPLQEMLAIMGIRAMYSLNLGIFYHNTFQNDFIVLIKGHRSKIPISCLKLL
jgi:hypothetical protein